MAGGILTPIFSCKIFIFIFNYGRKKNKLFKSLTWRTQTSAHNVINGAAAATKVLVVAFAFTHLIRKKLRHAWHFLQIKWNHRWTLKPRPGNYKQKSHASIIYPRFAPCPFNNPRAIRQFPITLAFEIFILFLLKEAFELLIQEMNTALLTGFLWIFLFCHIRTHTVHILFSNMSNSTLFFSTRVGNLFYNTIKLYNYWIKWNH